MGNLHGQLTEIMADTLAEVARKRKVKYNTLWKKAKRKFPSEVWAEDSAVLPEHLAALFPEKSATKKTIIRIPQPISVNQPPAPVDDAKMKPARAKFTLPTFHAVRRFSFNTLAIAVVCGHGYMIWQEAAELYGYIGGIGGAVVFAVVCLAVLIASDASRTRTSGSALWFMLFVDAAAGFVHYEALQTPSVPKAMTIGFCIFICACSFVALLLYRDSKLD